MKTTPMEHQVEGRARLEANPEYYALGAEQGTGKTWMLLDDAERQHAADKIDALVVVAPNGVHTNWTRREAPTHLSVDHVGMAWRSGAGAKMKRRLEAFLTLEPNRDRLQIFTMNIDALNTKPGSLYLAKMLRGRRCMLVVDESQRIKNPTAGRTKKLLKLGPLAVSRRIASGTMVNQGPQDLFSQFEFLKSGLLGTTSYRAFVAEYCDLLPESSKLVQSIMLKAKTPFVPQIVRRDDEGRPVYRNLDRLNRLLQPYLYRVLKKDCLDLPDKIYKIQYYELPPAQRKIYDGLREDLRFTYGDGDMEKYTALTIIGKLQQAASGFINIEGEPQLITEDNQRLKALAEILSDVEGQVIIWAVYRQEIAMIIEMLKKMDETFVEYHGGVKQKDRDAAIDDFQSGRARFFVGNAVAGGTGLTLTAAETAIYYSCSYDLDPRRQSEDRNHRIGTKNNVVYWDLAGVDTVDERVAASLQTKTDVMHQVLDGEGLPGRIIEGGPEFEDGPEFDGWEERSGEPSFDDLFGQ